MVKCNCKYNCVGVSIVVSVMIGVISAILRYFSVITLTPVFLWVVLGVAVAFLAITLITSTDSTANSARGCLCSILPVVLTGILGSVITSLILLGIEFAIVSVIGAILTGLVLLFFSLLLTSVACLVLCKSRCRTCEKG